MTLLDSLHINDGGGRVLLNYLVEELERNGQQVFYLFDERCRDGFTSIPSHRKIFMKASLKNRHQFYRKHGKDYRRVLCFGNLPPTIKLKVPIATYFHQPLFLKIPETSQGKEKLGLWLKMQVLNLLKRNTNNFLVQSPLIKKGLEEKYGLSGDRIQVLPFYPPLRSTKKVERKKDSFVYVSAGTKHKNHQRLLQAFCGFYDQHHKGKLILTVSRDFPDLHREIEVLQKKGYPIQNLGFIRREDLAEVYERSEFLIYPSLAESFGLGLTEAIEKGCKVLGANLPYTYAVCRPSLAFEPNSVAEIQEAMGQACSTELKESVPLIKNEINRITELLK